MYTVTFFLKKSPEELKKLITPLGFQFIKGDLVWSSAADGHFFRISPFKTEARGFDTYGYRASFNTTIDGAMHLFDLSIGIFQPVFKGAEYKLEDKRTKLEWLQFFRKQKGYKTNDPRGIFQKGDTLLVLLEQTLVLQIRSHRPKGTIKLQESLREIDTLLEEINPKTYDLFSFEAI